MDHRERLQTQHVLFPARRGWPGMVGLVIVAMMAAACDLGGRAGLPSVGSASAGFAPTAATVTVPSTPEQTHLKIALAGQGSGALPIYLAAEHTFREEGLQVELISFSGTAASLALASESVDIALLSLGTLVGMIESGQSLKAFYGGFNQADFEWFGRPGVNDWGALRGRSVAIGGHGDLTDLLTRYVLRKHGLEPERDVQIVTTGGSVNSLQALRAGVVDAAILAPPVKFQAEAERYPRLGRQASEVSTVWPKNLLVAQERTLNQSPGTVRAFVRGVARAIRLARADRELAVRTLSDTLQYERPYAERAYVDAIGGFDERGLLPGEAMPLFWQVGVATGPTGAPWPEARFFDRRFLY